MAVRVEVLEYEPGFAMPLRAVAARMYDIPAVGSTYWRDTRPCLVERVDQAASPIRVHLRRDESVAAAYYESIPDGWAIHAGRSSETGEWTADLVNPDGAPLRMMVSGATLDAAVVGAIEAGSQHFGV